MPLGLDLCGGRSLVCNAAPANAPVLLIAVVWLTVTVIAAWLWNRATVDGD
jgi:hypothetical protein